MKNLADRGLAIYRHLQQTYPNAKCELQFENAYQLLVATILSAQCTDLRVNQVLPNFFREYPGIRDLAHANTAKVEKIIFSTGFYHNKAKNLIACAKSIVDQYGGEIPKSMEKLLTLPGIGRKTANVVLGNAFGQSSGIVVDTHVQRLSLLLGLSKNKNPVKIEQDLIRIFPQKVWILISHLLIFHGRQICIARRPNCQNCPLNYLCPSSKVKK